MTFADPRPGLPDPAFDAGFYADVAPKRLIAWIVDTVLIVLVTAVLVPLTAFTALFFLPLLVLTVGFLYRWATLASRSATWGMRLVAIEFRRADGTRLDGATALLHTLGYTVSMAMVLPQVISVVLMLTGARGQGLSDHVLGTAAINRPAGV